MRRIGAIVRVLPLLIYALAAPAFAQSEQQPDDPRAAEDPCRAEPEDAEPRDGESEETRRAREEELAERLDRCNGVLTPPDIGEREMVEPPPDIGRTPVIRPDDLPGQQPGPEDPDEDSG